MKIEATNIKEYLDALPEDRKKALTKLRSIIKKNLPKGFKEQLNYGMLSWVVPHSKYPAGYHVKPELPLPFISMASQKNFVAVYHSGIYADPVLLEWFQEEYPKHSKRKLNIGKSCLRYKNMDDIPYELIGDLAAKMTVDDWIKTYEKNIKT